MSDAGFVIGVLLATLLPALVAGWAVRRWVTGRAGGALAAMAMLAVAWLGMGIFVSVALRDLAVAMD